MRTNPIKPSHLPRMGCCRALTCPPPQKRKREVVPRRWMNPSLRVGGRGVPPWHPKPGSSRSTGSYSSKRWRSRLRNWPAREDLAPASNSPIQFLRKAKVSAGFASCVLAHVSDVKDDFLWEIQGLRFSWYFYCKLRGETRHISATIYIFWAFLLWGKESLFKNLPLGKFCLLVWMDKWSNQA